MKPVRTYRDDVRSFYASMMTAASGSDDPRLPRIFEAVPREAFLPPGPWRVQVGDHYITTPSADPLHLYQDCLVALDESEGLNTGEPFAHARWIGAVAPQPGETVTQVGVGGGYYTAILSMMVLPNGSVAAFEIRDDLAKTAARNLAPFDNVRVIAANAVERPIPDSDIIYVCAGVLVPPKQWLTGLRPGGRMMVPWRPADDVGLALLITRSTAGLAVKSLGSAWFIACVGASAAGPGERAPNRDSAWQTRSVWLTTEAPPDETATAVYADVWFSNRELTEH